MGTVRLKLNPANQASKFGSNNCSFTAQLLQNFNVKLHGLQEAECAFKNLKLISQIFASMHKFQKQIFPQRNTSNYWLNIPELSAVLILKTD